MYPETLSWEEGECHIWLRGRMSVDGAGVDTAGVRGVRLTVGVALPNDRVVR